MIAQDIKKGITNTAKTKLRRHGWTKLKIVRDCICIGNSMICSDIWHKYYSWYFEIVIGKGEWNLRQFWNITSGIYVKYHIQIMLLFVYTTTRKRSVIFTCRYFNFSWNTTALSQSNCRSFSCNNVKSKICRPGPTGLWAGYAPASLHSQLSFVVEKLVASWGMTRCDGLFQIKTYH